MMPKTLVICALLAATFTFSRADRTPRDTYNAAVVEYRPFGNLSYGGERILSKNAQTIIEYASKARFHEADIIILPEYGLTGGFIGTTDDQVNSISQFLPNPAENVIPCNEAINTHTYDALKAISCTARDLKLYISVNLVEKINSTDTEPHKYFNTQMVFDRNGAVIARYRKKNLFFEPMLTKGNDDYSTAVFTTDFGITFTMQVCFDILQEDPAFLNIIHHNITNIVMSTYWFDALPFLTIPQTFSAWARGLNVNLLVASHHFPPRGGVGSGIFTGKEHTYVYDTKIKSAFIVKTIHPIDQLVTDQNDINYIEQVFPEQNDDVFHFIVHENMENYTAKILPVMESNWNIETLCDNVVCCAANYTYSKELSNGETYQLIAFDGILGRDPVEYRLRVQTCAVVHCLDSSINSCAHVNDPFELETSFRLNSIKGTFSSEFVYPSIFGTDFKLSSKFLFQKENVLGSTEAGMILTEPLKNLLSATLFTRYYADDPV